MLAYDADEDGFSEPRGDGRWGWRRAAVADLLAAHTEGLLCFAGCSEEQADLPFDYRVLLTAPDAVLIERLRAGPTTPTGARTQERAQILGDRAEIEPLLRRTADLILESTASPERLADAVLSSVGPSSPRAPGTATPAADAASGGS